MTVAHLKKITLLSPAFSTQKGEVGNGLNYSTTVDLSRARLIFTTAKTPPGNGLDSALFSIKPL